MRMRPPSRCACVGSDGFLAAFVAVTGLLHCNCRGTGAEPGARAGGGARPQLQTCPVCARPGALARVTQTWPPCVCLCVWRGNCRRRAGQTPPPALANPGKPSFAFTPAALTLPLIQLPPPPPHPTPNAVGFGSLGILFLRSLLSLSGQT